MAKEQKKQSKYNKRKFIVAFCVTMSLFAVIRHGFSINIPLRSYDEQSESIAIVDNNNKEIENVGTFEEEETEEIEDMSLDTFETESISRNAIPNTLIAEHSEDVHTDTSSIPSSQLQQNVHRVIGVHSWSESFPDLQDIQIEAAKRNGIRPCRTRQEAQRHVKSHKLVNVCYSPLYVVDDLTHSMPYLVPKAQHLLNTISLNFIDSLQCKGLPLHIPVVTSVLRTTNDVSKLQRGNKNATTNSCHCYGTTVDITYNRFMPITGYYHANIEPTRWSLPMKQVMAEVLRDLRRQGLCYVKYERKQACFHLTVRK